MKDQNLSDCREDHATVQMLPEGWKSSRAANSPRLTPRQQCIYQPLIGKSAYVNRSLEFLGHERPGGL